MRKQKFLLVFATILYYATCQTCTSTKTLPLSTSNTYTSIRVIDNDIPYEVVVGNDLEVQFYASSDELLDRFSASVVESSNGLQITLSDSCGCYGIAGATCNNGTCICDQSGEQPKLNQCSTTESGNDKNFPTIIVLLFTCLFCFQFNNKSTIFIVLLLCVLFSYVPIGNTQSNCKDVYVVIRAPIPVTTTSSSSSSTSGSTTSSSSTTSGQATTVCNAGSNPTSTVQAPVHIKNIDGGVSWFASPVIYDLDNDGTMEIIWGYSSINVFAPNGTRIVTINPANARIYSHPVVADLDGDGVTEISVGTSNKVYSYEYKDQKLTIKSGFPQSISSNSNVEVRGMAAADLNGDGKIELVVTTTQTLATSSGGSQVYAFSYNGNLYQPSNGHNPAWPRYNTLTGDGNDKDRNVIGHNGYGCYGLNVAIGNIDSDSNLEIITTYDNHFIQAFKHDGVAIDSSPYFTNRKNPEGTRLTWGQFPRWADPDVERDHYHLHVGDFPCVCNTPSQEWLQWTASPPGVIDLDLDGENEVIGIPNIEKYDPYITQAYGIFVIQGDYPTNKSATRKQGWEIIPRGNTPITVEGYYPPSAPPSPTFANIVDDNKLEIITPLNDGFLYCYSYDGKFLWKYDFTHNKAIMFTSEAVIADLNQDGTPEVIFATFGDPNVASGYLIILDNHGNLIHDIPLPNSGYNGNGNGSPAAPTVGDINGDGNLEILVATMDHGMDIFTVPGSANNCVMWPTGRGGNLRKGQPDNY